MQRKIMLHLSDPTHGIKAIKFIDLNSGEDEGHDERSWIENLENERNQQHLVGPRRKDPGTRGVVQQLVDNRLEGVKLVHEFSIHGVKLVMDLGLELCKVGIGRANLICHLLDGFLVLIDGSLQVLVASVGHLERGSVGKGKWWVGPQKGTYK
jgi:hypothetical protein